MKRVYRLAGFLVAGLSTLFFLSFAAKNFASLPPLVWDLGMLGSLAGATILYVLGQFAASFVWLGLLRGVGEQAHLLEALMIFAIAQFAKYVPGNVAHHAGRVALARTVGLRLPHVMVTMTLEAGCLILAAAFLALVSLLAPGGGLFQLAPQAQSVWELALIVVAAAVIPLTASWGLSRWRPPIVRRLLGREPVPLPRPIVLFGCFVLDLLTFLLMGSVVNILAQGVFHSAASHIWTLTAIFSVAWVAGFLTPGSPAGLGVREAVLVVLLGPLYGAASAVGITVSLRVVTTLGDGLALAAGFLIRRFYISAPNRLAAG